MTDLLSYRFNDPSILTLALSHRSASNRNNERLEFLGDAVLGQVIADYLFNTFPDADEGQLTRTRAHLVNKNTLANIAREIDIGAHLILGEGELKSGGWRRDSILANTLEALIGAIYVDGGMAVCVEQILIWFNDVLQDVDPQKAHKDPKTQLQEYLQGRGEPLPVYTLREVSGPPHEQKFTIACEVSILSETADAEGRSRRAAEQLAAAKVLALLGVANP